MSSRMSKVLPIRIRFIKHIIWAILHIGGSIIVVNCLTSMETHIMPLTQIIVRSLKWTLHQVITERLCNCCRFFMISSLGSKIPRLSQLLWELWNRRNHRSTSLVSWLFLLGRKIYSCNSCSIISHW